MKLTPEDIFKYRETSVFGSVSSDPNLLNAFCIEFSA